MAFGNQSISITFIKKIGLFVLVLCAVDFLLGAALEKLFYLQRGGKYSRITRAIYQNSGTDVLVLGSSTAHRHYIPSIISDETRLTCYNAGTKGQRMIFNLALQESIYNHYKPKYIILNIDPKFLSDHKKQYEKLADLLPYYRKNRSLEDILSKRSRFEKYKLISNLYPYNSTLAHIFYYLFTEQRDDDGFRPLRGTIKPRVKKKSNVNTQPIINELETGESETVDLESINAFKRFIDNCKKNGTHLILVTSPNFSGQNYSEEPSFTEIKRIANSNDIPFIDFSSHQEFSLNGQLFHDYQHLNERGAKKFTHLLADELKYQEIM